jgi:hypothetical protein
MGDEKVVSFVPAQVLSTLLKTEFHSIRNNFLKLQEEFQNTRVPTFRLTHFK